MSSIKYLSGPISWYHFKNGNKEYILFGDLRIEKTNNREGKSHNCLDINNNRELEDQRTTDCATISAYLSLLLQYNKDNNMFTDVFLEKPFVLKESYVNLLHYSTLRSHSGDVYLAFNECLTHNKSERNLLPTIRFHYSDIRYVLSEEEHKKGNMYINGNLVIPTIRDRLDNFKLMWKNNVDKSLINKELEKIANDTGLILGLIAYYFSSCIARFKQVLFKFLY